VIRKNHKVKSVDKLTYKAMWTIEKEQWLNDDVINISV